MISIDLFNKHCSCSSGRHRDEEVFEMKAQKRYKQINKLLDMESKINSSLAEMSLSAPEAPLDLLGESTRDPFPLYTSKHEHLEVVCQSAKMQGVCLPLQKWRCQHDGRR